MSPPAPAATARAHVARARFSNVHTSATPTVHATPTVLGTCLVKSITNPTRNTALSKTNMVDAQQPGIQGRLARCKRCMKHYDESECTPCMHHPGRFQGGPTASPPHGPIGWTCCAASEERSRGCAKHATHLRCEITARALASFDVPVTEGGFVAGLRQRSKRDTSNVVSPTAAVVPLPSDCTDWYEVGLGDTLASVCLRHGMRRHELMKLNKLLTSELYPGQKLRVRPAREPTTEEKRATGLRRIMIGADVSLLEAEFYYAEADGDIELALQLCLTPSGEEVRKAPGAILGATDAKQSRDEPPVQAPEEKEEAGLGAWLSSWFGGKKPAAVELQMMGADVAKPLASPVAQCVSV